MNLPQIVSDAIEKLLVEQSLADGLVEGRVVQIVQDILAELLVLHDGVGATVYNVPSLSDLKLGSFIYHRNALQKNRHLFQNLATKFIPEPQSPLMIQEPKRR